eukprot:758882-Hanusia_phi.AAC.10
MKNCACSGTKCYCVDEQEAPVGAGSFVPSKIFESSKAGKCSCSCSQATAKVTNSDEKTTSSTEAGTVVSPSSDVVPPSPSPSPSSPSPPPPPPPPQAVTQQDAIANKLCTLDANGVCKSLLNIRCSDWRDLADSWAPDKQKQYYAKASLRLA